MARESDRVSISNTTPTKVWIKYRVCRCDTIISSENLKAALLSLIPASNYVRFWRVQYTVTLTHAYATRFA